MKYYSQRTVRKIASDAEKIAFSRQCGVKTPTIEISDYPSFEIPDKHGDLKDTADIMQRYEHEMVKLKAELPKEQYEQIFYVFHVFIKPWIDQAPTVLEAST